MKFDNRDLLLEKFNMTLDFLQSYDTRDDRVIQCARCFIASILNGNPVYYNIEEMWEKEFLN